MVQHHPLRSGGYGRRGCRHGIGRSLDPTTTQKRLRMASGTRLGTQHRVQCWCRRRQCAYQCLVRIEHRVDEIPEVPSVSASVTDPNRLGDATVTPELIDGLRSEYEHVIVAAPPLLPRSHSERGRRPGLSRAVHRRDHPARTQPRRGRAASDGCAAHRCGASLANRRRRQKARSRAVRRTPNPTTVTGSIS